MIAQDRTLLHDVSEAYVRARRNYEQHQARRNSELADQAFGQMQTIEASISIRELNSSWREPMRRAQGAGA